MESIQRTCRFFDPAKDEAETSGLISGPDYPYDKHYGFALCSCPAYESEMCMLGGRPEISWDRCRFYEPEATQRLGLKQIIFPDHHHWVLLDLTRLLRGVGEYRILTFRSEATDTMPGITDDYVVTERIHTHDHADADTLAREMFERRAQLLAGGRPIHDVSLEVVTEPEHPYLDYVTESP